MLCTQKLHHAQHHLVQSHGMQHWSCSMDGCHIVIAALYMCDKQWKVTVRRHVTWSFESHDVKQSRAALHSGSRTQAKICLPHLVHIFQIVDRSCACMLFTRGTCQHMQNIVQPCQRQQPFFLIRTLNVKDIRDVRTRQLVTNQCMLTAVAPLCKVSLI